MKSCLLVAGTRPNFVKIAPLYRAFIAQKIVPVLVHTGQHFDGNMSDVFFSDLGLPPPDVNLGISGGDRISQTKKIIAALVPVIQKNTPDAIVVVGDVTSTIAATIAALSTNVPLIHVESGLRSFNLSMPEEVNRIFVDHNADELFVTEPQGVINLSVEGIAADRIHLVGNVMIDSLMQILPKIESLKCCERFGLTAKKYIVATVHRPQNVDTDEALLNSVALIKKVAEEIPVVFPVHPRTKTKMESLNITFPASVICTDPLSYTEMISLMRDSAGVITDSGGIQEETTVLGIPCITLRTDTERPITITEGTNELIGMNSDDVVQAVQKIKRGDWKKGAAPHLWDGHAADRIVEILMKKY